MLHIFHYDFFGIDFLSFFLYDIMNFKDINRFFFDIHRALFYIFFHCDLFNLLNLLCLLIYCLCLFPCNQQFILFVKISITVHCFHVLFKKLIKFVSSLSGSWISWLIHVFNKVFFLLKQFFLLFFKTFKMINLWYWTRISNIYSFFFFIPIIPTTICNIIDRIYFRLFFILLFKSCLANINCLFLYEK